MFYWGCAWLVYFSHFLKEGKKPMTYDFEKLPTPVLYIPEIVQGTFDDQTMALESITLDTWYIWSLLVLRSGWFHCDLIYIFE